MKNIHGVVRSAEFLKAHPEQDPKAKEKEKEVQEPLDDDVEPEGEEEVA